MGIGSSSAAERGGRTAAHRGELLCAKGTKVSWSMAAAARRSGLRAREGGAMGDGSSSATEWGGRMAAHRGEAMTAQTQDGGLAFTGQEIRLGERLYKLGHPGPST